jgi:hypothetical protein
MKTTELRKLIREEVRKVLKEATPIMPSTRARRIAKPEDIKANDIVMWTSFSNERGMYTASGQLYGKVVKVLGSKSLQVEVIAPAGDEGAVYRVEKRECTIMPKVGQEMSATTSWDGGAGSGSQGSGNVSGTVKAIDFSREMIAIESASGGTKKYKIEDLSSIVVYK